MTSIPERLALEQTPPGRVVLFGSGETSPSGRKIFDRLLRGLPSRPRIALLETPAGFEPNSEAVIGRVAEFLRLRLRNYSPQIEVIRARRRGTALSPENPEIAERLLDADLIFMGPGSPTYAVRQLANSATWDHLRAQHRMGATVVFASAAVIAISTFALPVYEIYKVGEELHWKTGLNFFTPYGLPVIFVPHWNNHDGGDELDTSRCFMGKERFSALLKLLPPEMTVIGIDENTALSIDLRRRMCEVNGLGSVTLIQTGVDSDQTAEPAGCAFTNGETFPIDRCFVSGIGGGIDDLPAEVWEIILQAKKQRENETDAELPQPEVPENVMRLTLERQAARERKDWVQSDALRLEIASFGWAVRDTPGGPILEPLEGSKTD